MTEIKQIIPPTIPDHMLNEIGTWCTCEEDCNCPLITYRQHLKEMDDFFKNTSGVNSDLLGLEE